MESVCRQCGVTFSYERVGRGRPRMYCSQRCTNRYHYERRGRQTSRTPANTMKCSSCARDMWRSRSSLPEGQAMCHPCRRARSEALDLIGLEHCRVCGKPLSPVQRRRGGQYCSQACGYVHILRINPEPYEQQHKRYRRLGVCRAVDEASGLVIYGPGRRQHLSLHRYNDGRWTLCCRQCAHHMEITVGQLIVQCDVCTLYTELDRPLEEVRDGSTSSPRRRVKTATAERGPAEATGTA